MRHEAQIVFDQCISCVCIALVHTPKQLLLLGRRQRRGKILRCMNTEDKGNEFEENVGKMQRTVLPYRDFFIMYMRYDMSFFVCFPISLHKEKRLFIAHRCFDAVALTHGKVDEHPALGQLAELAIDRGYVRTHA